MRQGMGRVVATIGLLVLAAGAGSVSAPAMAGRPARLGQPAPELDGGPWINSPALTSAALRGRVLLIEFWTYG
jgi:hypothetical protein